MLSVFERMSERACRLSSLPATVVAIAILAALLATPAGAGAGQYHVYSCRTPNGESAPADGWSGSATGSETFTQNTCAQGGALVAALRAGTPRTATADVATWAFGAPAGETLAGATLWRAGDTDGGAEASAFYAFWFAGPTNTGGATTAFGQCGSGSMCPVDAGSTSQPLSTENRVVVPAFNLGENLYVNASCGGEVGYNCPNGPGDPNGYAAVVYLYAADLTLEQGVGPTASSVSGELASAPAVAGTSDVAFSASDPGSGVYEAVFNVDGHVVQSTVVDDNGGRCENVGQSADGLPAFLYEQPCSASVSADVGFDTTRVGNGAHHLVVSVIDAAGNAATVLDRNVVIANPPPAGVPGPPNGTNASSRGTLTVGWKGTKRERLTSNYGHTETIVGRLTAPGGVPIGGARIDVLATPDFAGSRAMAMVGARTAADGRFAVRVPGGVSSRTLRLSYRSHLDEALPSATRTLTLSVRAGVALSIAPRTASVGGSIRFTGRLRGGPIPHGGKPLVLEARSPGGRWLEFDVIRSDSRGRYHAGYRFKFPGPAEYQFRVLCEAEADYPFATGSSEVVGVRER
jgi:hypothetical protein